MDPIDPEQWLTWVLSKVRQIAPDCDKLEVALRGMDRRKKPYKDARTFLCTTITDLTRVLDETNKPTPYMIEVRRCVEDQIRRAVADCLAQIQT